MYPHCPLSLSHVYPHCPLSLSHVYPHCPLSHVYPAMHMQRTCYAREYEFSFSTYWV